MAKNKDIKNSSKEMDEGLQICEKCGSKMIEEEGDLVCPKCDGEIDFFGDGEEDTDG